jgi:hypothetical protein
MAEHDEVVQCPLCQGHGEMRQSELAASVTDQGLKKRIEACLDVISAINAEVDAGEAKPRDFQKEVHSWNPQLPIWRRSPKE